MTDDAGWRRRVDPKLLTLADDPGEDPDSVVQVFVRFTGPAGALREHGLDVRSVAGDVATASVALRDLPRAAGAPGVVFLQASGSFAPRRAPNV